uniref:Uncharacterized protein n=1 Tax=Cucumis melo TaxID=3656 RepID=A0A9I9EL17_CUCME
MKNNVLMCKRMRLSSYHRIVACVHTLETKRRKEKITNKKIPQANARRPVKDREVCRTNRTKGKSKGKTSAPVSSSSN